jgi:hypothetical protein
MAQMASHMKNSLNALILHYNNFLGSEQVQKLKGLDKVKLIKEIYDTICGAHAPINSIR